MNRTFLCSTSTSKLQSRACMDGRVRDEKLDIAVRADLDQFVGFE